MSYDRTALRWRRRAQARLWTGAIAHFVGGALDVSEALARYGLARLRARVAR